MNGLFRLFPSMMVLGAVFFAGDVFGHGMSEEEKQSIVQGATHMLGGLDHLLFVFGVVFFLSRFLDVVKYVTAFTVGHTITLITATYMGIQVNYYLIDAFIALSVFYIAFVNLGGFQKYFSIEPPNLMVMVFGIGLVHGMGLSTRLQELPLVQDNLLMQIISFNVGVEIGQIAALAIMLGVLTLFRSSGRQQVMGLVSNVAIAALGALLFIEQMHGYSHITRPDDFGFSHDYHVHAHEAMEEAARPRYEDVDIEDLWDD